MYTNDTIFHTKSRPCLTFHRYHPPSLLAFLPFAKINTAEKSISQYNARWMKKSLFELIKNVYGSMRFPSWVFGVLCRFHGFLLPLASWRLFNLSNDIVARCDGENEEIRYSKWQRHTQRTVRASKNSTDAHDEASVAFSSAWWEQFKDSHSEFWNEGLCVEETKSEIFKRATSIFFVSFPPSSRRGRKNKAKNEFTKFSFS